MSEQEFESYLRLLGRFLRLSDDQREAVRCELRDHMEERLGELLARGYTHEEAITTALDEFGDAAALASEFGRIGRRRRWIMRTTAGTIGIAAAVLIVSFLLPENRPHVPAPAYTRAQERAGVLGPERPKLPAVSATVPVFPELESQADQATWKRLETTIPPLDLPEDVVFGEALEALKTAGDVPISVNWNVLNVVGIDRETPILGLTFENVKLGTALESLLDSVSGATGVALDYEILDGMVRISTQEDLNRRTEVRVYDCRDLIDPPLSKSQQEILELLARYTGPEAGVAIPSKIPLLKRAFTNRSRVYDRVTAPTSSPARMGMGGMGMGGRGGGGYGGDDDDDEETSAPLSDLDRFVRSALSALEERHEERAGEFVDLIKNHVTPGLWEPEGVVASVSEYDGLLVIGHTKSGHRQVLELLAMLRQAQAARAHAVHNGATASSRVPQDHGPR